MRNSITKVIIRIHYIIVAILMLFILPACQPTPEKGVVIQKDNFEDLVHETAEPNNTYGDKPIDGTEQPTVSDELAPVPTGEYILWKSEDIKKYPDGHSTRTIFNVDAYVDTGSRRASVFTVQTKDYSLEFANRAVGYFLGNEYYEGIYTKEDLLLKIMPLKQAIHNMVDYQGSKDSAESYLKILEGQYDRAPESNISGVVEFDKEWNHTVLNQSIGYLCLKGYPHEGAVSELYIGNGDKAYTNLYYFVEDGTRAYRDPMHIYTGKPARSMDTSYDDAKSIAEDAIEYLYGEEMAHVQTDLSDAWVVDENWGNGLIGQFDANSPQCYVFTFTPIYGGLPQLYAPEARNDDEVTYEGVAKYEPKWDYEYSMKWPAHYIQVYVDDNGVVEFYEFSPAEIVEQINDNVQLLSFDEIFKIFKKNIFYSSVWCENSSIERINIRIDNIEFGMIRVPMRDNPESFYMIPAWQFSGSKTEIPLPGGSVYSESGKTFLALNALDGSIIDTSYFINFKRDLLKTIGRDKN